MLGSRRQRDEGLDDQPSENRSKTDTRLHVTASKPEYLDTIFRILHICSTSSQTKPEGCVEVCGCVCTRTLHNVGSKPRTSLSCAKQVLWLWGFFPPYEISFYLFSVNVLPSECMRATCILGWLGTSMQTPRTASAFSYWAFPPVPVLFDCFF